MPRTKAKTRYSEWKLYNLNALYSVLEYSCLILSKWKRLKVRVDGWSRRTYRSWWRWMGWPPIIAIGSPKVKHWIMGAESSTSTSGHIHVRLSCSTFLFFPTTLMFNFILCTKLIGTVPSFTVRCIYLLKLLKNRQPAQHDSMILESSLKEAPWTIFR